MHTIVAKLQLVIDLRGLNYSKITGINTFTLHVLYQLWLIKKQTRKINVIGVGLKPHRIQEIGISCVWFTDLIDCHISIGAYCGLPSMLRSYMTTRFVNTALDVAAGLGYVLRVQAHNETIVWLPQPRGFPIPSRSRLITTVHDVFALMGRLHYSLPTRIRENKRLYTTILNSSSIIQVNSISTGRDIERIFPPHISNKIHLVYPSCSNWRTISRDSNKKTKNILIPSTPYILAISGIEPRKNWINLILAHHHAQQVYPEYHNITLVLAGFDVSKTYHSQIHQLINNLHIRHVEFVIAISEHTKQQLLKHCLFVAYPSLWEGFGFPILEAFSYHKAVLTSNLSSMPELAQEGGLFVNPYDIVDIARGLRILSIDNDFRANLEQNAARRINDFSWDEIQSFWKKVLISHEKNTN